MATDAKRPTRAIKQQGYAKIARRDPMGPDTTTKEALAQQLLAENDVAVFEDEEGCSEFELGSSLPDIQEQVRDVIMATYISFVCGKFHVIMAEQPRQTPKTFQQDLLLPPPKRSLVVLFNPTGPPEHVSLWPSELVGPIQVVLPPGEAVLIKSDTAFLSFPEQSGGTSLLLAMQAYPTPSKTRRPPPAKPYRTDLVIITDFERALHKPKPRPRPEEPSPFYQELPVPTGSLAWPWAGANPPDCGPILDNDFVLDLVDPLPFPTEVVPCFEPPAVDPGVNWEDFFCSPIEPEPPRTCHKRTFADAVLDLETTFHEELGEHPSVGDAAEDVALVDTLSAAITTLRGVAQTLAARRVRRTPF